LSRALSFLVVSAGFNLSWNRPEDYREMQKLQQTFLLQDHIFSRLRDVLRQMLEEKVSHPVFVIGSQLTVGELLVEPKFSVGVFCQSLLQRSGMRKGNHGIGRRVD